MTEKVSENDDATETHKKKQFRRGQGFGHGVEGHRPIGTKGYAWKYALVLGGWSEWAFGRFAQESFQTCSHLYFFDLFPVLFD